MKNMFKKIMVLLIGLVTLASCSFATTTKTFEYETFSDYEKAIKTIEVDGRGKNNGFYTFDFKDEKLSAKYSIIISIEERKANNITKDNLVLELGNTTFRTTLTKEITNEDGSAGSEIYFIDSKAMFAKDILSADVNWALSRVDSQLENVENAFDLVYDGKTIFTCSSNVKIETLKTVCLNLLPSMKYLSLEK